MVSELFSKKKKKKKLYHESAKKKNALHKELMFCFSIALYELDLIVLPYTIHGCPPF